MAGLGRYLYNTLSDTLWGPSPSNGTMNERNEQIEQNETEATSSTSTVTPHQLSIKDVFEVKQLLFDKFDLPLELVDVVIDFAEYWPSVTSQIRSERPIQVRSGAGHENVFLVSRPAQIIW